MTVWSPGRTGTEFTAARMNDLEARATAGANGAGVTADTLSGATTVGKAVIKATDAPAARTAIAAVGKGDLVINVKDAPYNADPTGAVDATTAIQAAADAVYALITTVVGGSQPTVKLYAQGKFKVSSTITINVPCDLSGATFTSTQTTGVVVQVGSATLPLYNTELKLPQVISSAKTTTGWAQVAGTTGVRATNLYGCRVYVPNIKNFETGLWVHAQNTNGTSYNAFYFGAVNNNKVNLKLSPESTGTGGTSSWVNTNTFNYGSFNHQTPEGTQVSGVRHVFIDNATWPINDNEFHRLSLETNNVVEYHVECYGHDNLFDWCRWEDSTPGNIRVLWRGWSYRNVINGGIDSELISYTTETGAYNFGAATPIVSYPTASIPASLGAGGLIADSTASRLVFSPDGILKKTVAMQDDIISTLTGTGPPEGVVTATPGTSYTRTDTGNRTNACKYPIADGVAATTGWSYQTGALTAGAGYLRNTMTASTGAASRGIQSVNSSTYAVTPLSVYSFSVEARTSNAALSIGLRAQFFTSAPAAIGTVQAGSVVVGPSSFTRLGTLTLTAPSNAAWVYLQVAVSGGPANADGDTLDARHMIYELSSYPGTFFAGDTTSGGGATYAWTGTAQASTSTATYATSPITFVKTGSGNTGWKALAPAGAVSVPSDATDAGTTQTLVNALKSALVASGIVS